ncbi:fasciclin domain-containing protein [Swingsia samuiensis]|uniref:FAS1 domain-containing protein n=1 Tax=Swingsia samuiensis TaxID=1293412 RepID=A0A4Y6UFL5_9PROT|nr:fasciclin domain-containing protein [Swingsia samuiensis]QDH16352.1 hypothetical protein E3D00_01310 [Swingsia samuiensis]
MPQRFAFSSSFRNVMSSKHLRLGSGLLLGLALAACHKSDWHGTDWSHNYQDSFETHSSTKMRYMPDTVTQAYTPSKNGEPNTIVAYHRPPSPSYEDRPLDENIGASVELADYFAALKYTGLVPWITGPGPITVFAIPNKAMEDMSARWRGGLMTPAMKGQLTSILGYTIVSGKWDEKALRKAIARRKGQGVGLKTLYGTVLSVHEDPQTGELFLNNPAGQVSKLWGHSFPQSNGVLYFTQGALLPISHVK